VALLLLVYSDLGFILEAEWHRTQHVSAFAQIINIPGIRESLNAPYPQGAKFILLHLMLIAAPCIYGVSMLAVAGRRIRGPAHTAPLEALAPAVFGLPLLNQVRITPTFNHLLQATPLVLVTAVYLVHLLSRTRRWEKIPGSALPILGKAVLLLLVCGLPVFYNLAFTKGVLPPSIGNRFTYTEPIGLDRAGLYESPQRAKELKRVVKYIESTTEPGDPLFAGPFSPAINFLARRPPAVRFLEPFYYFRNEEMQKRVVEDLERNRPPLILLDPVTRVGQQSLPEDAPRVYAHITGNYFRSKLPGRSEGPYQIWLRRDGR
jgi:hypothetical protein